MNNNNTKQADAEVNTAEIQLVNNEKQNLDQQEKWEPKIIQKEPKNA